MREGHLDAILSTVTCFKEWKLSFGGEHETSKTRS